MSYSTYPVFSGSSRCTRASPLWDGAKSQVRRWTRRRKRGHIRTTDYHDFRDFTNGVIIGVHLVKPGQRDTQTRSHDSIQHLYLRLLHYLLWDVVYLTMVSHTPYGRRDFLRALVVRRSAGSCYDVLRTHGAVLHQAVRCFADTIKAQHLIFAIGPQARRPVGFGG